VSGSPDQHSLQRAASAFQGNSLGFCSGKNRPMGRLCSKTRTQSKIDIAAILEPAFIHGMRDSALHKWPGEEYSMVSNLRSQQTRFAGNLAFTARVPTGHQFMDKQAAVSTGIDQYRQQRKLRPCRFSSMCFLAMSRFIQIGLRFKCFTRFTITARGKN